MTSGQAANNYMNGAGKRAEQRRLLVLLQPRRDFGPPVAHIVHCNTHIRALVNMLRVTLRPTTAGQAPGFRGAEKPQ